MKVGKSVWIVVAVVVLLAGVGAAVALLDPRPRPAATGARGPAARIGTETVIGATEDASTPEAPDRAAAPGVSAATSSSASEPEVSATMQSTGAQPATSGKRFAYVRKAWRDGDRSYVTVDFAELLTGDAAAKAASDRGAKSPPPKGYFIVNDDTAEKTVELEPQARVRYVNGDVTTQLVESSTDAFVTHWTNGDVPALRVFPYYITVENDIAVQIDQLYLP